MKGKTAEKISQVLLPGIAIQALQVPQGTGLGIELFELMLGKIADPDGCGGLVSAQFRLNLSSQHFYQRRFTRAVMAQ